MSESMMERVARALWDDRHPDKEWGDLERMSYTGHARAAIEAMREPTERMLDKGDALLYDTVECSHNVWNAMIDAALIWPAGSADIAGVPMAED